MSTSIKKIGVLTSGGDSPGMNACIRAVTRSAIQKEVEVVGIKRGYEGLLDRDFRRMLYSDVGGIIHRGGTILKSARSKRFHEPEFRAKAANNLRDAGIDALVTIGGDGTFTGAAKLGEEHNIPIIGTPGTIDNDLFGTDATIGYDTALNTALEAIDRIKDTADSHHRMFFIEVMGRDVGFIALYTGIAGGAEAILIPETQTNIDDLVTHLEKNRESNSSSIIVVAEGDDRGGAKEIAEAVNAKFDYYETKVSVLGHIQRGGRPTCADRILGTRTGIAAVLGLLEGKKGVMAGVIHDSVVYTPFANAIKHHDKMNPAMLDIAKLLSCHF